jgi:hypothetical protein
MQLRDEKLFINIARVCSSAVWVEGEVVGGERPLVRLMEKNSFAKGFRAIRHYK